MASSNRAEYGNLSLSKSTTPIRNHPPPGLERIQAMFPRMKNLLPGDVAAPALTPLRGLVMTVMARPSSRLLPLQRAKSTGLRIRGVGGSELWLRRWILLVTDRFPVLY